MGADIHVFAEVKHNGNWEIQSDKFNQDFLDIRSYAIYGFLAGVRNYSHSAVISAPKGFPADSSYLNSLNDDYKDRNSYARSWLTLKELLDFDYDQMFENRRIEITTIYPNGGIGINGAGLAEEGKGEIVTYGAFLGEYFFKEIDKLQTLGTPENVRIIFWFD